MGVWTISQAGGAKQEMTSMALGAPLVGAITQETIVVALTAYVAEFEVLVRAGVQARSFKVQI
jgi:hypothetical protein